MQEAKPDYAQDPEVPKNVPVQDANDNKVKEFQSALAAEKKKRRSKPWLVALLSLLLITLGAAAAVFVSSTYFNKPANNQNATKDSRQNTTKAPEPTPKVGAAQALTVIKKAFPGTSTKIERPILALQVPGYNFYTDLASAEDYTGVSGEIAAAENTVKLAEIGRELKAQNFIEELDTSNTEISYTARYTSKDAACIVTSQGSQSSPNADHAVQAACADMSVFKELAAKQAPFAQPDDAVRAASPGQSALYGKPVISQSATDGYKTAKLGVTAANAAAGAGFRLFYQKTPSIEWTYITSTGDTGPGPECSAFNTADAKKAYAGTPCYNDSTASTVTP